MGGHEINDDVPGFLGNSPLMNFMKEDYEVSWNVQNFFRSMMYQP